MDKSELHNYVDYCTVNSGVYRCHRTFVWCYWDIIHMLSGGKKVKPTIKFDMHYYISRIQTLAHHYVPIQTWCLNFCKGFLGDLKVNKWKHLW